MTLDGVAAVRAELWDAGFRPVPIKNHDARCTSPGKKPGGPNFGNEWAEAARQDPPAALSWRDPAELNTGVLCDGLRAFDIDIEDATIVARIRATAFFMFGDTIMRVRDNSARCLLVYRAAEGEPAKRALKGTAGKVECLGKGQQFVAYGIHATGTMLRWMPDGPRETARDKLAAVTEAQIDAFFREIAPVIGNGKEEQISTTERESDAAVREMIDALRGAGAHAMHGPADLNEGIAARLDTAIAGWEALRKRWAGDTSDLAAAGRDTSRSGRDMSLAALVKGAGFSPLDAAQILLAYEHGSAQDVEKHPSEFLRLRYVARTVLRSGTAFAPRSFGGRAPGDAAQAGDNAAAGPTEDETALAFAGAEDGRLAFDHTDNQWFLWRGDRWRRDDTGEVFDRARDYVRAIRETMDKSPKTMAKISFVSAVERAARHDRRLAVSQAQWDTDPMLLGVPGGMVDLRDGRLISGDPSAYVSKQTIAAPAERGTVAREWTAFLAASTKDDKDLQAFLQRFAGYCLTGDVTEEVLTFIYGPGGNGKGVFVGVLTAILAEYAVTVPIEAFTANSTINLEYYRAQMAGARLVTASETEAGAAWRESQIKELTGNETPLSARRPYGQPFTFRPQCKFAIVGNHAPRLRGRSPAMERRLRVVPFINQPTAPDPGLKARLVPEYPAILRWMIDGCLAWQRDRLGNCAAVQRATSSYFEQQDGFRRWLDEGCILDPSLRTPSGAAYLGFKAWCAANGEDPAKVQEWAEMVERTPGLSRVKSQGKSMIAGLGLRAEADRRMGE